MLGIKKSDIKVKGGALNYEKQIFNFCSCLMNAWAAGAFVGGYVGWYAKQFAAAGPVGAGVAAVITAGAAATAKWAVENGIRRISLGKYIGGWNWNYTINIP